MLLALILELVMTLVGVTSTMITSMKGVKMSGLTERLTKYIQALRVEEIIAGTRYRMLLIYTAIIGE